MSKDTIYRQDAIDTVRKCSVKEVTPSYMLIDKAEVMTELMLLPSAETRKGKWIPVTNGRGGHECDQCHEYAPSWQTGEEHLTNFCPSCGAMMEDEE